MSKMIAEELLKIEGDGTGQVRPVSSQEHARLRELLRQVDWYNADERKVIADVVTRKMVEEIRREDITQFFADTDTFNVGDTPEYSFTKGLKAHVHEPGTFAPRSTFIQRTVTIGTELVTVHPEMELSQLQAGRYGTMATMKNMAREELLGHKNAILWTVLINSIPSTAPEGNFGQFASTAANTVKKNFLISGIDYVDDVAPGGVRAIVGRRSVMGFINELGAENTGNYYSENMKNRIEGTGGRLVGEFRGIPLVALHQYTDGYDVNRINANNLMIVANDTTKLAVTEPISTLEDINIDDRTWHWRISEKYGGVVFWPERNYRIAIT
jgi:hypothetical protein